VKLLLCSFLIIGSLVGRSASAATFYVGTNGDDSNSCTQAQDPATPKRNITAGLSCLGLVMLMFLTFAQAAIVTDYIGCFGKFIRECSDPPGAHW
jgi:hypothetical protein